MNSRGNWQKGVLGPGQYTRSMLASEVSVSLDTIKRWQREGLLVPISTGGSFYIFEEEAINIARRLIELSRYNLETRMMIIQREFGKEVA